TVCVDVSGVRSWSLLAQAMLLSTAKRLADNGGQLVLYRPTEALRHQSRQLGLFDRVSTQLPPSDGRG
ncbi:MAG: STAS domain-containing protein, partial [Nocardioidaceae bacterium]